VGGKGFKPLVTGKDKPTKGTGEAGKRLLAPFVCLAFWQPGDHDLWRMKPRITFVEPGLFN
jgi:hypothetical protein